MNFSLQVLVFTQIAYSLAAVEAPSTQTWPFWDGNESVVDYSRRVNLPPTKTLDVGNGVSIELVLIPAGQFMMGATVPELPAESVFWGQAIMMSGGLLTIGLLAVIFMRAIQKRQRPRISLLCLLYLTLSLSVALYGTVQLQKTREAWNEYQATKVRYETANRDEKPAHSVTITTPFYMGKFLVTQEQYISTTGANPSSSKGQNLPVETVFWKDIQGFCELLGKRAATVVRLPTEAEWEYACRAGTRTAFYTGDTEADLARAAWYEGNSNGVSHPVGQKEPNGFGLFDMLGNVGECCQDRYNQNFYSLSPTIDPLCSDNGDLDVGSGFWAVSRGGSWGSTPKDCRLTKRNSQPNASAATYIGFRIVMPVNER